VVSLHWGGNWGFDIPSCQRDLAHALIDEAGVDVVVGHSSHHPKRVELHRGRLILYGCGDLVNDYEGIGGYESYRGDLALAFFPEIAPEDGSLVALDMVPYRRRRFRLERADGEATDWLADAITGQPPGIVLARGENGALRLVP
jgi:poly-gamma-glutamate synthesis protein (capsule biosynthesis protein)